MSGAPVRSCSHRRAAPDQSDLVRSCFGTLAQLRGVELGAGEKCDTMAIAPLRGSCQDSFFSPVPVPPQELPDLVVEEQCPEGWAERMWSFDIQ